MDNNNTLITERLILRKLKQEDAEAIFHNWASDPEVARYVTWPAHTSIETTNALV
ncbi:MAG: GNAT family N-acetyltransferase, partial [Bacilli bacterium]|nr:GNAT family N-acetyltransferase [Bacilli bacterium]